MENKLPIIMKKGIEENLPFEGNPHELYFAEDTGNLYKSNKEGGALIPYSGVVGTFNSMEELELSMRLENKFYILHEEGKYAIYIFDKKEGFLPISTQADKEDQEGDDINILQVTKLNVVATPEEPYELKIPIEYTADFRRLPIEVLKMEGQSEEGVTSILADFDNSEKDDFEENEFVEMDGTMRIRTNWEFECDTINKEKGFYSFDLKELDKIEVIESFNIQ